MPNFVNPRGQSDRQRARFVLNARSLNLLFRELYRATFCSMAFRHSSIALHRDG